MAIPTTRLRDRIHDELTQVILDAEKRRQGLENLREAFDEDNSGRYFSGSMSVDGEVRKGFFFNLDNKSGAGEGDVFIPAGMQDEKGKQRVVILTAGQARNFDNGSLVLLREKPDRLTFNPIFDVPAFGLAGGGVRAGGALIRGVSTAISKIVNKAPSFGTLLPAGPRFFEFVRTVRPSLRTAGAAVVALFASASLVTNPTPLETRREAPQPDPDLSLPGKSAPALGVKEGTAADNCPEGMVYVKGDENAGSFCIDQEVRRDPNDPSKPWVNIGCGAAYLYCIILQGKNLPTREQHRLAGLSGPQIKTSNLWEWLLTGEIGAFFCNDEARHFSHIWGYHQKVVAPDGTQYIGFRCVKEVSPPAK